MEEMLQRIRKISKLIQVTMSICMLIFGFYGIVGIAVAFIPLFTATELAPLRVKIVESANLLPINVMDNIFGETHLRLQIVLSGVFIAFLAGVLVYCIFELKKIFKQMNTSRTPFTAEYSDAFKKLSIKTLIICPFSTLLGVVCFFVIRLLAYIFEYGTYIQGKADETNRIQEEMIMSFAEITENKSEQTGKHIRRVAEYSRIIAEEIGLGEDRAKVIRLASTMHDIGKLLIPSEILEKPARLTDEEFDMIKKHPGYGEELLRNVEGDVIGVAKTIALEHHERPDGRGYPKGLQLDSLSLEGQIVAVADVYDALTSKRSYKEAWDEKAAYNEILKGRGTQFSEKVVDAFERAYPDINTVRQQLQEDSAEHALAYH